MMRYILVLLLAWAATVAWQSNAVAAVTAAADQRILADQAPDKRPDSPDVEPECE